MSGRFDAVLFDCDGVLVDSEGITNGVLRDMLEERGWRLLTFRHHACIIPSGRVPGAR